MLPESSDVDLDCINECVFDSKSFDCWDFSFPVWFSSPSSSSSMMVVLLVIGGSSDCELNSDAADFCADNLQQI